MLVRSVRPRLKRLHRTLSAEPRPSGHRADLAGSTKSSTTASGCGDAAGVRLFTGRGIDWTGRYPSIAAAVAALSCRSCLIDGEVVICGEDGIPVFDRLRYGRQPKTEAVLFAFDLLELGGKVSVSTSLAWGRSLPPHGTRRDRVSLARLAAGHPET